MILHCSTNSPYIMSDSLIKRIFSPICHFKGHKYWKVTRIEDNVKGKLCERCGKFVKKEYDKNEKK